MSNTTTTNIPSVNDLILMTYTGDADGLIQKNMPENTVPTISAFSVTENNITQNTEAPKSEIVVTPDNAENSEKFMVSGDDGQKKMTKQEQEEYKAMEKAWKDSFAYIKDKISPSMMKIDAKKLQIGDTFVRTIYTYAYPDVLEGNWLSPLINWDVKFDVSMFIYPVDSARVMRFLRTRLTQLRSQALINREK